MLRYIGCTSNGSAQYEYDTTLALTPNVLYYEKKYKYSTQVVNGRQARVRHTSDVRCEASPCCRLPIANA